LFLVAKELTAPAIHIRHETILHEKAVEYSTVPKYLRSTPFGERDAVQADLDDTCDADLVDQTILQLLAFQPFVSVHQISRMILLSKSTICRHLTESLGFISQRLRSIASRLSKIEKEARVEKSEALLRLLLLMKHQLWKYIVALDEAWSDLWTDHEMIWLASGKLRPDIKRLSKTSLDGCLESSWLSCA
jgi:hypothetical protein